jgi:signal peptidase I
MYYNESMPTQNHRETEGQVVERAFSPNIEQESELDPEDTASMPPLAGQESERGVELDEEDRDTPPTTVTKSKRTGFKSLVFDFLETILLTIIIYAVLSTFIGRYKVLSVSMEPNLYEGQYLLISKQTHKIWPLKRGDIVVFHYPRNPEKNYIKRLIGLPGEKIEFRSGQLYINDELTPEPWLWEQARGSIEPRQLGEDEFFVMGDNRNNTSDSRSWGPLGRHQIIGRAVFRYWPLKAFGPIPSGPKPTATPTVHALFDSILTSPLSSGTSP